jgi:hypothetical protein
MRIPAKRFLRAKADCLKGLLDQVPFSRRGLGEVQVVNWGGEYVVNPVERVVNLERVLKDDLNVVQEATEL